MSLNLAAFAKMIFYVLSGYNNHLSQKKIILPYQNSFNICNHPYGLNINITLHSPSCPEGFKVSFYNLNHVIWFSFEQDTIQKPLFSYFLQGQVPQMCSSP
jgi:hypothetical protein